MRSAIVVLVLVLVLGGCGERTIPPPTDEPFCIDDSSARCPYGDGGTDIAFCSDTEIATCESGELQTCPNGGEPYCPDIEP